MLLILPSGFSVFKMRKIIGCEPDKQIDVMDSGEPVRWAAETVQMSNLFPLPWPGG
jgi:hypothetical protein